MPKVRGGNGHREGSKRQLRLTRGKTHAAVRKRVHRLTASISFSDFRCLRDVGAFPP